MLTPELRSLVPVLRKSAYLKLAASPLPVPKPSLGARAWDATKAGTRATANFAAVPALAATTTGLAGGDAADMTAAGVGAAAVRPLFSAGAGALRGRASDLAGDAQTLKQHHEGIQATADPTKVPRAQLVPPGGVHPVTGVPVSVHNRAELLKQRQGIQDHIKATAELPAAQDAAGTAARRAGRANVGARVATGVAPVAAAAAGQALVPATEAVGRGIASGAGNIKDAVKDAVGSTPAPDYLQIAKDYMPAVAIVGASAALAMWLMSRDDDENEKTAAVIDDDHLARAARNRRRLEGLLARNPGALDNVGKRENALHELPISLDATSTTKLAALLNKTP